MQFGPYRMRYTPLICRHYWRRDVVLVGHLAALHSSLFARLFYVVQEQERFIIPTTTINPMIASSRRIDLLIWFLLLCRTDTIRRMWYQNKSAEVCRDKSCYENSVLSNQHCSHTVLSCYPVSHILTKICLFGLLASCQKHFVHLNTDYEIKTDW